MRQGSLLLFFLLLAGCSTPTERWLKGMADYKELRSGSFNLEIMKIRSPEADTSALNYKIRLFPAKQWMDGRAENEKMALYYGMDSCFSLKAGKLKIAPSLFQPVNNGIAGCYEYLVSFELSEAIKSGNVQLIYQDRVIDGKKYILELKKE